MTGLIAALAGGLISAGLLGTVASLRPPVPQSARPRRASSVARLQRVSLRTRVLALVSVVGGLLVGVVTGWLVAAIVIPAAVIGLPALLATSPEEARIAKLDAMAEWTRNLAGVLTVGVGLEQALVATLRSTPEAIKPEVSRLVARLRARWGTEEALRAFADDVDDATGDLVAAYLILGARRRGAGLASVLQGLADSVAEDVTIRRRIEADRAKPRSTARYVTLISAAVLLALTFTGSFMAPYGTPLGQLILLVLLAGYIAALGHVRGVDIERGAEPGGFEVVVLGESRTLKGVHALLGKRVVSGPEERLHLLGGDDVASVEAVQTGRSGAQPHARDLAALGVVGGQSGVALLGGVMRATCRVR